MMIKEKSFTLEGQQITGYPIYEPRRPAVLVVIPLSLIVIVRIILDPNPTLPFQYLTLGAMVGFIVAAIVLSRRHFPRLVLNTDGIFDSSPSYGAGAIGWDEIKSAFFINFNQQRLICFRMMDVGAFLTKQDEFGQDFYESTYSALGAPIALRLDHLAIEEDELRDLLDHYKSGIFKDKVEVPM